MIDDYSRDLLRSGIIELKAGNRDSARRYIDRALYMSSDHDVLAEGWYWMSQLTDDPAEKRRALENCLSHDLRHARARRALAILDGKLDPRDIINPDNPHPPTPKSTGEGFDLNQPPTGFGGEGVTPDGAVDAQRFMCPKCGGRMTYSPDGQSLVCDYCAGHQSLRGYEVRGATLQPGNLASNAQDAGLISQTMVRNDVSADKDFIVAMATARGHGRPLAEQVFHCQGCGAQFILSPGQLSITCPYCASPHVVSFDKSPDLLAPDGIIPHAFNQSHATELLAAWLPPVRSGSEVEAAAPRGLYLPLWTFDLGGAIDYTGVVVEEQSDGYGHQAPRAVTVSDSYPVMLSRLPIPASRKLSAPFVRLLSTFDLTAVQPYDPRYLADWPAELYDLPMAEASLDARSQGFTLVKRDMGIRLAPLRLVSASSAHLTIESFRLNLLPVWMTELIPSAAIGGQDSAPHLVLINGQTGDIRGDLGSKPSHSGKLLSWLSDLIKE